MSLINAISIMHYTTMMNNAAYSMMKINNSRMGLLTDTAGGIGCSPSLEQLAALDTQLELDAISNSMQYQMAKAILEQLKKQQKEDAKRFSVFG